MKIELDQAELRKQAARGKLAQIIHGNDDRDRASALGVVAATMRESGAVELSHQMLEEAFQLDPSNPELQRSLGLSRCRFGDLSSGLALYDKGRWKLKSFQPVYRDFPQSEWRGESLEGKAILLWAEQGIGDQVMQVRCLRWILAQKPKRVAIECDSRLHRLLQNNYPEVEFYLQSVVPDQELTGSDFDFQSSLFSAWKWTYALSEDVGTPFPPYLKPDSNLVDRFRKIWAKNGWRFNVGISWRSQSKMTGDRKSISPKALSPLLKNPKMQFHNLQYGCGSEELEELAPQFGRRLLEDTSGDPMNNLYQLTAQIAALDLVISVDNTTVHLAGAIGTPCLVMLPKFNDWRWGASGTETYLYESLFLIRQNQTGSWTDVILQAGLKLRAFSEGRQG